MTTKEAAPAISPQGLFLVRVPVKWYFGSRSRQEPSIKKAMTHAMTHAIHAIARQHVIAIEGES
jgi:hypothetical protein